MLLFLELVERVQRLVAKEIERLAVDLVGAALGGDGDDAAGSLPVLGWHLARMDQKLTDRGRRNVVPLLAAYRGGIRKPIHEVGRRAGGNPRTEVDGAPLRARRVNGRARQQQ